LLLLLDLLPGRANNSMEDLQIYLQEEGLAAAGRVRQKILAAGTSAQTLHHSSSSSSSSSLWLIMHPNYAPASLVRPSLHVLTTYVQLLLGRALAQSGQ
jgi:hypothetical protein